MLSAGGTQGSREGWIPCDSISRNKVQEAGSVEASSSELSHSVFSSHGAGDTLAVRSPICLEL